MIKSPDTLENFTAPDGTVGWLTPPTEADMEKQRLNTKLTNDALRAAIEEK